MGEAKATIVSLRRLSDDVDLIFFFLVLAFAVCFRFVR